MANHNTSCYVRALTANHRYLHVVRDGFARDTILKWHFRARIRTTQEQKKSLGRVSLTVERNTYVNERLIQGLGGAFLGLDLVRAPESNEKRR